MPHFQSHGRTLFYRESGAGPLLVILPGNTASSVAHAPDLEHFSSHHRVVALDFLGTGGSERLDRWPEDWWLQGARDALTLVSHLGERRCLVLGCSGGAVSALWMAVLAPEVVRAVVADSVVARWSPEKLRAEVAAREQAPEELRAFWAEAHGADWREVVRRDGELLLDFASRGDGDVFDGRLAEIACPVLIAASLNDSSLPDVVTQVPQMARQIPLGEAHLLNQGDHALIWTARERFLSAAAAFFTTAPA